MESSTVETIFSYVAMSETNLIWSQEHFECFTVTADICTTIVYVECNYDILIKLVESKCCF